MTHLTTLEQIVEDFLNSLPETYQDYLKDQKLEDNAVNQLGFLSAVLQVVQEDGPENVVVHRLMLMKMVEKVKEATERVRELVRAQKKA